jgi:DNA-binding FadR family transcriptional regulator
LNPATACPPNANWPSASASAATPCARRRRAGNAADGRAPAELRHLPARGGRQGSLDALVLQADLGVPLTEAEVAEVVELRRILELQAVRLACERRRDTDIDRLDAVLAAGESTIAAGGNLAGRDAEFHLAVAEATGNHVLLRVVNSFYLLSRARRRHYFADGTRAPTSQAQHAAMRDAIAARDAQRAVALMGQHLQGVESYWRELLQRRADRA